MDIFKKVWEGNERLVITFWVWYFIGSIIVNWGALLLLGGMPYVAAGIGLVYSIFAWVATWRSSDKYQGANIWALLAKIVVVLGVLGTILNLMNPGQMPF